MKQVFIFNVANNFHKFVPPFTLYFNIKNAQNPAWKHFEKTNSYKGHNGWIMAWSIRQFIKKAI